MDASTLFTATLSGHAVDVVVKRMIDSGADVNHVTEDGRTPLHAAAFFNRQHAQSGERCSLQTTSSTKVSTAVAELLINADACVHAEDNDGNTPLHMAAKRGWHDLDMVKCLVSRNANVNCRNHLHQTPLHLASGKPQTLSVVQFLVQHAADTTATDHANNTPLAVASLTNNHAVERFLSHVQEGHRSHPDYENNARPALSAWTKLGGTTSMHFMHRH